MEFSKLKSVLSTENEIVVPLIAIRSDGELGTWKGSQRMEETSVGHRTDCIHD